MDITASYLPAIINDLLTSWERLQEDATGLETQNVRTWH